MTSLRLAAAVLGLLSALACGNPAGPSPVDKVAAFAAVHVGEMCVLATRYDAVTGVYTDYGILVPIGPTPARVMPLSYCNPAE